MRTVVALLFFALFAGAYVQAQIYGPNRAQTIAGIFQIPIQTLTAISNVAQTTRPIAEVIRQRRRPPQALQYAQQQQQPAPMTISRAARVAGLRPASDGSFFRI